MQKTFFFKIRNGILHLFFWSLVWFFFYLFFRSGTSNAVFLRWFTTLSSVISIIASYVFVYDLLPNYLLKNNYRKFVLYSLYAGVFVTTAVLATVAFGFVFFFNLEYQQMPTLIKSPSVILVSVLLIIVLASGFKILQHSYQSLEEKNALENRFLQTQLQLKEQELRLLKMQIQPHFLFNTLNTIYGLAIQKKENAPEMILKLSNLLDYILYQVEKPKVFLEDEIAHLEDYISLEKMRFHDTLKVDFTKNITSKKMQISPMLLIPFVENSFKHGVLVDGFLNIKLNLKVTSSKLIFTVENNFKRKKNNLPGGIGLENIKKRLEMLYPQKHLLEVTEKDNTFKILLEILL